ncbi:hypothetical protein [Roseovarius aquimarinus]|uniref:Uncharacterized protein n=1 Tax=Roseovarius aquimarinus TaxID=1229156 RepID=A0ABW7I567_9RHOB
MPNSTPAPKGQPAKAENPAQPKITRAAPRKVKSKPQVISRQIFSDFASI